MLQYGTLPSLKSLDSLLMDMCLICSNSGLEVDITFAPSFTFSKHLLSSLLYTKSIYCTG